MATGRMLFCQNALIEKLLGLGAYHSSPRPPRPQQGTRRNTCKKMGDVVNGPIDFLERKLAFARVVAWFLGTAKLGSSPLHFSPLRRPPNGSFSISIAFRCCLPLICFPPFAISISILKTPIVAGQLTFAVLCLYLFAAPPDALARRVSQNSRNRHRLKR
ncbi:hypothetical protein F5882DRAFT_399476 [Hyaloscypha sp. PMI_1271]|nr:hypothetical protein F5882DRAFT_399476 [Hyaloscypha sp. PMI_1271]